MGQPCEAHRTSYIAHRAPCRATVILTPSACEDAGDWMLQAVHGYVGKYSWCMHQIIGASPRPISPAQAGHKGRGRLCPWRQLHLLDRLHLAGHRGLGSMGNTASHTCHTLRFEPKDSRSMPCHCRMSPCHSLTPACTGPIRTLPDLVNLCSMAWRQCVISTLHGWELVQCGTSAVTSCSRGDSRHSEPVGCRGDTNLGRGTWAKPEAEGVSDESRT